MISCYRAACPCLFSTPPAPTSVAQMVLFLLPASTVFTGACCSSGNLLSSAQVQVTAASLAQIRRVSPQIRQVRVYFKSADFACKPSNCEFASNTPTLSPNLPTASLVLIRHLGWGFSRSLESKVLGVSLLLPLAIPQACGLTAVCHHVIRVSGTYPVAPDLVIA
jgi:hypothetical protein